MFKKSIAVALAALMLMAALAGCGAPKQVSLTVLSEDFGAEEYGIGFRKNDVALGMEVSRILDEMNSDGTAAAISNEWFGEDILMKDAPYVNEVTEPAADDTSLKDVQAKGKLVLGLDDSFPPMGFRDDKNEIVGFDIDLAREVCKRLGVELELKPIDWSAKELELDTKKIDCIWNGMTITPERTKIIFFARPYVANRQIMIVAENGKVKSKADLAGKKVGLQDGSSALDAFNKDEATAKSIKELKQYPNNVEALMDLEAGRIDAVVVDEVVGRYAISKKAAQ